MKFLKFSSTGCKPCERLAEWLKSKAIETTDYSVENSHSTTMHYRVRGVPTVIKVDDDGLELGRMVGFHISEATQFFQ